MVYEHSEDTPNDNIPKWAKVIAGIIAAATIIACLL